MLKLAGSQLNKQSSQGSNTFYKPDSILITKKKGDKVEELANLNNEINESKLS